MEDDSPAAILLRASSEPRAAAQLRAAYTGRHDALDALAWRVSPGSPGPSGADDPAGELGALQARVYGRDAQLLAEDDRVELEASLARLMQDLEHDRVLLDEALSAVRFGEEPAEQEQPESRRPIARVLPRVGALRGILAALVVGALVTASVVVAVAPADSLEIFARPVAAGDPAPPDWLLQARSVEASAVRWIGDAGGWSVFVLTDAAGHLCMTLVEGSRGSGSCLTPTAFAAHGLSVELPFAGGSGSSAGSARSYASWGPVGGLRVQVGLACETLAYPC